MSAASSVSARRSAKAGVTVLPSCLASVLAELTSLFDQGMPLRAQSAESGAVRGQVGSPQILTELGEPVLVGFGVLFPLLRASLADGFLQVKSTVVEVEVGPPDGAAVARTIVSQRARPSRDL